MLYIQGNFFWRFLRRNKSKHGKTIMFCKHSAYNSDTEELWTDLFIDNPERQFKITEILEKNIENKTKYFGQRRGWPCFY